MVCPHCGTRGRVTTAVVKQKKGISGAKATGVVLTGGLSALVTGLSKKAAVTMASCGECRMTWTIS
jgi:transcription elongation factor Elf1